MKRWVIIVLFIIALVAAGLVILVVPPDVTPEGEASARLYRDGTLGLRELPLELVDQSRATEANGDFPGADSRSLSGSLYLPEDKGSGPFPLIVYSHGFMSTAEEARYYAEFLAPKGYVVAAVSYPLSNGEAPGGPNPFDVANQPGDVSFIIDTLLLRNGDSADELYGVIDAERIGVAGLSLGGLTTTLAAFHRDLRDDRIKAAASIAGPASMFSEQFFETTDAPFLMIAGTTDGIVPYGPNAAPIPELDDNAILVSLEDGSHVGFAALAATMVRWSDHPDGVVCPMLMASVPAEGGEEPPPLFAPDEAVGVVPAPPESAPCLDEYTDAMGPYEQLMLTRLALFAFFESAMSPDAARREDMRDYLVNVFAIENANTRVEASF